MIFNKDDYYINTTDWSPTYGMIDMESMKHSIMKNRRTRYPIHCYEDWTFTPKSKWKRRYIKICSPVNVIKFRWTEVSAMSKEGYKWNPVIGKYMITHTDLTSSRNYVPDKKTVLCTFHPISVKSVKTALQYGDTYLLEYAGIEDCPQIREELQKCSTIEDYIKVLIG